MPDEILSLIESRRIPALVRPVNYDTIGVPDLENSEIKKIAMDVLDAVKYAYASVASNPEQEVRRDTIEADFKEALGLMKADRRESIHKKAVQLTGFSEQARAVEFGRYGAIDSKSFIAQGADRIHESLEPLEINTKLLGIKSPTISMSPGDLRATPDGLLLPKENLPTGFEEDLEAFETDVEEEAKKAETSEVYGADRLAEIWGPSFTEDPFEMVTDEFEEEFEEQAVKDKLAFYITKVKCVDETNPEWWGHDEIAIAGVSVDEDGDTKRINEKYVGGGFDDGDTKNYSPHWHYHWFGAHEGKGWPKNYFMTLILAEKDHGGLSNFLNKVWKRVKDMVKSQVDRLGALIGSYLPWYLKWLGSIISWAVNWVINRFVNWIIGIFEDDIFPPRTVTTRIYSYGARWRHADGKLRNYSPRRRAHFYGHGGHYYVEYYWKMYA